MHITQQNFPDNIIHVTVTLEPVDYSNTLKQKLQQTAAKATIKGFRQGKVPTTVINKMYGQNILGEIIEDLFSSSLTTYFKENKINYLAQPILSKDNNPIVLDPNSQNASYTIKYEVAQIPNFEIGGLDNVYTYYEPLISDEEVKKEASIFAKRLGKMEEVSEVGEEDLITVIASQTENGQIKEDGISKEVILMTSSVDDPGFKALLLTKKLGDEFEVEVSKLENKDLHYIKTYLFGLKEDFELKEDDIFHYKIKTIRRLIPAELTDEIVQEKFGAENLAEFEDLIKEQLINRTTPYANQLLHKDLKATFMASTHMDLSRTFAKEWLMSQEKMDEEAATEKLDPFLEELKWNYIQADLINKYNISVDRDSIMQVLQNRIGRLEQQYGKLDEKTQNLIVKQWLEDKNENYYINEEARSNKLFETLFEIIRKDVKKISPQEITELFNNK